MADQNDRGNDVAKAHGIERSPEWPAARARHLVEQPACVACGDGRSPSSGLQVHHQVPFHFCILLGRPDLELDQRNLITLCEVGDDHHLLLGHLDNFQSDNPSVHEDAAHKYQGWTATAIKADPAWQARSRNRPKDWAEMTDADKQSLRAFMDARFPVAAATATH
jgi:hypothetical protein